jgi:enterochelin esterase-like enzyme
MAFLSKFSVFFVAVLVVRGTAFAESPSTRSTAAAMAAPPGDDYPPGPDSQRQKDVPQGKQFSFDFDQSKVFPGTTRKITVYIPAQYKPEKPACLYIGLDGLGFGVPIVFDNLIHKKEMPVTIAIGVSPGQVPGALDPKNNPRFNRSNEFDSMNDSLAKLILEEIIPEVEKRKTPDGLEIKLSKDPNDHCTGGGSTGAIGAFTLAWQRPDQFRRVFSAIGTYVGMRGGDQYPVLVRKTEPKPIRIFMQDGAQDEWMGGPEVGDWWMSNQMMLRALEFSGYQVEHIWGTGPHSGKQAAQVFPDAMRFLWKDWPQPVKAGESQNKFLTEILAPGEGWKEANPPRPGEALVHSAITHGMPKPLAANSKGEVWALSSDGRFEVESVQHRLGSATLQPGALAFGPGDILYIATGDRIHTNTLGKILTQDKLYADDLIAGGIVLTSRGDLYATKAGSKPGLNLIRADGKRVELDKDLDDPTCISVSPDGQWLAVLERRQHHGYSYRILADGSVDSKQSFYWLHQSDDDRGSRAMQSCFDRDGKLYVATEIGVQVLDRNGRSRAILPLPGNELATGICFGGKDFNTIYVSTDDKIYKRTMKSKGLPPAAAPVKLPPWGAG